MRKRETIEESINAFLEKWNGDQMDAFFRDIVPLIELYQYDENGDWVAEAVGEENERNVRLIRTVYLISRIADFHSATLCRMKIQFKDLWRKMEKCEVVEGVHE